LSAGVKHRAARSRLEYLVVDLLFIEQRREEARRAVLITGGVGRVDAQVLRDQIDRLVSRRLPVYPPRASRLRERDGLVEEEGKGEDQQQAFLHRSGLPQQ
jgi:hypothetical protein